jgi:hypothetical protein
MRRSETRVSTPGYLIERAFDSARADRWPALDPRFDARPKYCDVQPLQRDEGQAAILAFTRALRDTTGNLPPMPGIFPNYGAVRQRPLQFQRHIGRGRHPLRDFGRCRENAWPSGARR